MALQDGVGVVQTKRRTLVFQVDSVSASAGGQQLRNPCANILLSLLHIPLRHGTQSLLHVFACWVEALQDFFGKDTAQMC